MSCHGACCAAFTLTPDLEELEVEGGGRRVDDEAYIADMVVPITASEAVARLQAFGGSIDAVVGERQWYRCRHWDEGTRLCREYASRPSMCRNYPYMRAGGCEHGCSCRGEMSRPCGVWPRGKAGREARRGRPRDVLAAVDRGLEQARVWELLTTEQPRYERGSCPHWGRDTPLTVSQVVALREGASVVCPGCGALLRA